MSALETKLDEWLVKKAPFQLPENGRKGLVNALPWITLVGGILMLWVAYTTWQVINYWSAWDSTFWGTLAPAATQVSPLLWVSVILLAVEAVMFFVAFPALKAHKKSGWNILLWVSLLNAAEAVVQVVAYTNLGSLIVSLAGSVIGLYLLFQVRSYYTGAATTAKPAAPQTPPATPPAETK